MRRRNNMITGAGLVVAGLLAAGGCENTMDAIGDTAQGAVRGTGTIAEGIGQGAGEIAEGIGQGVEAVAEGVAQDLDEGDE